MLILKGLYNIEFVLGNYGFFVTIAKGTVLRKSVAILNHTCVFKNRDRCK